MAEPSISSLWPNVPGVGLGAGWEDDEADSGLVLVDPADVALLLDVWGKPRAEYQDECDAWARLQAAVDGADQPS